MPKDSGCSASMQSCQFRRVVFGGALIPTFAIGAKLKYCATGQKQDKAESMRVTSVQCHMKVFITRQREDRRVHYKTKTACSLPVVFFRESHKMLSGKVWLCLDDSRFTGHCIIPRIFISLDEAKSSKRRNFAHLSVHSPNICQWYVVFIKLALHCSF